MKSWKTWVAIASVAGLAYFMVFHWGRFLEDFWPVDASRIAPNVVASVVQYAILAILVALLYPPARRAIERFASRHVDSIKAHISAEHDHLHRKLDHIVRHSKSIPNEIPGLPAHRKVKP